MAYVSDNGLRHTVPLMEPIPLPVGADRRTFRDKYLGDYRRYDPVIFSFSLSRHASLQVTAVATGFSTETLAIPSSFAVTIATGFFDTGCPLAQARHTSAHVVWNPVALANYVGCDPAR